MRTQRKPPVPTEEEQWLELERRIEDAPRIPREVLALYYARAVDCLSTPEGREQLARRWRRGFARSVKNRAETVLYLQAADAVERQDWPVLGRVLRKTEQMDFGETLLVHRRILRLCRWFERRVPGAAI